MTPDRYAAAYQLTANALARRGIIPTHNEVVETVLLMPIPRLEKLAIICAGIVLAPDDAFADGVIRQWRAHSLASNPFA